jgi:acyl-CoA synthetase (AMP-forming)/AMP-acid ligase II
VLFLDLLERNRRERPDEVAILHEDQRLTFAELDRASNRVANALGSLGVAKGDRVTLALGNSIEWLLGAFGALKSGAILNPVNPDLGRDELSFVLEHAAPRVVITAPHEDGCAVSSDVAMPRDAKLVTLGRTDAGRARPLGDLVAKSDDAPPPVVIDGEDGSTLLYTSGTTGRPKGVLFTHGRTGGSGDVFVEGLGVGTEDVVLTVGPLFHGNAWAAVTVALRAGCPTAFPKIFSAKDFWALADRTGETVLFTLGTILAILLAQSHDPLERRTKLRTVLGLGSAPLRERLRARFGFTHVVECFGSTDAGVVTLEPRDAPPRPGSAGPALPGVTIQILDDDGRALPAGETGEIAVASPQRMACYFRDPERTRAALLGDFFLTGDLGYLDADGWLYFVDRKRDVIRRGGENVASVQVEKVLREHPAVADVAVVGVRDPVLGQEIKAFVVTRDAVTAEDLEAFARARLAKFQVPRLWEFRDSLPKTPTQRVEKYKLRGEPTARGGLLG